MEQVMWLVLGLTVVVCSVVAQRSRRALETGCWALAALFVLAGAAVNAAYLLQGENYAGFADGSAFPFVTDTWNSLVVPNHEPFILLLIAFEATVGVLVLLRGRPRRLGLLLVLAFHVALVSFGWAFLVWSGPMVLATILLLRAMSQERRAGPSWYENHRGGRAWTRSSQQRWRRVLPRAGGPM
jgi:hypothetical protein